MNMRSPIILIAALCTLMGCTNKYVLDRPVIDKYNLSHDDLRHIQFYNSEDIVLTRYEASSSEKTTDKGALNLNYGKQVDQVIIKAGTPGKVVQTLEGNRLAVSFEPDDSKFLVFGTTSNSNVYHLQALEWKENRGKVSYGGTTYYTNSGADNCFLRFTLIREYREDRKQHIARGNRVR